jgi:hypothetical protein
MRRLIGTLVVLLAVLAACAGTALADGPVQSTTQSAGTAQSANAASSATQVQPSNDNISVRVLSPGNDGPVSQSNTATSSADASNNASTQQSSTQDQGGGCGCSPFESTIGAAQSGDPSGVLAGAGQMAGGSDGHQPAADSAPSSSSQANDAGSTGDAASSAPTAQTASQSQNSGSGVQSSQQSAGTDQSAVAGSSATQVAPSNQNISVRVLSPGDNGDVTQSNDATSSANAANSASTTQGSWQGQGGGSGSGVQSAVQTAGTDQQAVGLSSAEQVYPTNSNGSVRVLSPGNDGSVSQANDATSSATATNDAPTTQTASQWQKGSSCGCGGSSPAVQAIGQSSWTKQAGIAASDATQIAPSNSNDPVRVWSPGDGGDVSQSNDATSSAQTTNDAPTTQYATQGQSPSKCGCNGGSAVQALGQSSSTDQLGVALSAAVQKGAGNSSDPVRIWSPGDDGSTSQANDVTSSAGSTNTATTTQSGSQWQAGSGVQALGQKAQTWQGSTGLSLAAQLPGESRCGCASSFGNESGPVRVASPGYGGDLSQQNDATSSASTTNDATTYQDGRQGQWASCGCSGLGVQALGQEAATFQLGKSLSAALQVGPTNTSSPIRVLSPYGDRSTSQENGATSAATPDNAAGSRQTAAQLQ